MLTFIQYVGSHLPKFVHEITNSSPKMLKGEGMIIQNITLIDGSWKYKSLHNN